MKWRCNQCGTTGTYGNDGILAHDCVKNTAEIECRKIVESLCGGKLTKKRKKEMAILWLCCLACFEAGYKRALLDRMKQRTFDNEDMRLAKVVSALEKQKLWKNPIRTLEEKRGLRK
jgi:hypothetical protein